MRPLTRLLLAAAAVFLLFVLPGTGAAAPGVGTPEPLTGVTVLLDGLPVDFPISPFLEEDVAMVPIRALSEALGFRVVWNGEGNPIECVKGERKISLRLGDAIVTVEEDGIPRTDTMRKAAHLQGDTTVVPIRFFGETLGYKVAWDRESRTADVLSPRSPMQVWGFYALGSANYSSWEDMFGEEYPDPVLPGPASPASGMTGAFFGWFAVDTENAMISSSGHPSGFSKPEGWPAALLKMQGAGGDRVAMFYADNQGGRLSALLNNQSLRDRLAYNMATAVTAEFRGAAVDFEGLGVDVDTREKDAANLAAFFESLGRYLHDSRIFAVLPPLNSVYRGYDHKRLGELSEAVVLMAYGYEDPAVPSATAPWSKVDEAVRLELEVVPRDKIILGVPAYGTLYATQGRVTTREGWPPARDAVAGDGAEASWDPASASRSVSWEEGGKSFRAFLENNDSLRARVSLAKRYGLSGVAIWRLGFLQPWWWEAVREVVDPVR